ncbi:MAG TPA: DUF3309 family protein [Tepidisphaeraceae bacterium]|nr:DUF3309 family protein [Tepidisphaeraceae bacterium]
MNSTARLILIVVVVLLLLAVLPTWPYSSGWGYYPSGGLGLVLLIVLLLIVLKKV